MLVVLGLSAARIPVAALLISSSVLIVCVVLMSRTIGDLPSLRRLRRLRLARRARPGRSVAAQPRVVKARGVTGVRPTLPAGPVQIEHVPLRRPARQFGDLPDTQRQRTTAEPATTTAEQTIERLLANEPEVLAGIISEWLRTKDDRTTT